MGKRFVLLLVFCLLFSIPAFAAGDVGVVLDGETVEFDEQPQIVDDRTMVPVRSLSELLGARVYFDRRSKAIRILRSGIDLHLIIGRETAWVNGGQLELDHSPFINNGRTFVPIRFLAETFGLSVGWDRDLRLVLLFTEEGLEAPKEPVTSEIPPSESALLERYSVEEIELLARLIEAEARGQPFEGKIAVGAVVLNRVENDGFFPDTIAEVIHQPGQFTVVTNGSIDQAATSGSRRAALWALSGRDPSKGALYFFNPSIATDPFLFGRTSTVEIGDHRFAR